jgi:hypothetical protein
MLVSQDMITTAIVMLGAVVIRHDLLSRLDKQDERIDDLLDRLTDAGVIGVHDVEHT